MVEDAEGEYVLVSDIAANPAAPAQPEGEMVPLEDALRRAYEPDEYEDAFKGRPAQPEGGEAVAKLQAFKDYVHQRLDDMGVPADPESPHKAAGCRVGGRLDYVEARITRPAPAQQAVTEWMPIETAPKDGETPMLFWDEKFPACAPFIGYRGADFPDDAACDIHSIACYPSHWIPLPTPPASNAAASAADVQEGE